MFKEFLLAWGKNLKDFLFVLGLFIALLVASGIGIMLIGFAGKFFGVSGVVIVGILCTSAFFTGLEPAIDYLSHLYFKK